MNTLAHKLHCVSCDRNESTLTLYSESMKDAYKYLWVSLNERECWCYSQRVCEKSTVTSIVTIVWKKCENYYWNERFLNWSKQLMSIWVLTVSSEGVGCFNDSISCVVCLGVFLNFPQMVSVWILLGHHIIYTVLTSAVH